MCNGGGGCGGHESCSDGVQGVYNDPGGSGPRDGSDDDDDDDGFLSSVQLVIVGDAVVMAIVTTSLQDAEMALLMLLVARWRC